MKHVSGKLLVRRRWGDGPLRASLAQITAKLNLQHKVCFLGELRNEQVASYYHACDVFALAALTRTEAFGIAQVKAMAAGKPVVTRSLRVVICTTAGKVRLTPTPLADLAIVNIDYFEDDRGFFIESWNKKDFAAAGLLCDFVQDSHSCSRLGVIRGLHYQDMPAPAAKLVRCTAGRILDVAVDLRAGSSTFGKWFGTLQLSPNGSVSN